ncbi:FlxA-like family protein [Belliella pelovolcani]|uniref:FlxA-like family protein n=1 Tax=Belliella pelovolcani TaxID=529505 RepID=UPI00391CDB0C
MSQQIKLEIIGDKVKVITPYHADFVNSCRRLRGRFSEGAWWFDDSVLEYVREAMMDFFNTTGEISFEEVSLLVKNYSEYGDRAPVTLFGRIIAKAFGRDSGARLGDDIVLIKGEINSGGSVKRWSTRVMEATFEIQRFPKPATELPEVKKAIEEGWVELIERKKKRPAEDIQAEIDQLEERIAQLKAELQNEA